MSDFCFQNEGIIIARHWFWQVRMIRFCLSVIGGSIAAWLSVEDILDVVEAIGGVGDGGGKRG
jgi:hypothetical protein